MSIRDHRSYSATSFDSGQVVEQDTVVCHHCQRIVKVKPGTAATTYIIETLHVDPVTRKYEIQTREDPGAFCRGCMKPICLTCEKDGRCIPFMRRIEQMEARGRQLAAMGIS